MKVISFQVISLIVAIILILRASYLVLVEIDAQHCSMTYMWEVPSFNRHFPDINESDQNRWYGLYHYSEGYHDVKLKGIPVLFIPGNSGSYKQVRSLASVSLRMSLQIQYEWQLFDYFTIDLNEELSAISGQIVRRQIAYIEQCLSYISSKYGGDVPIIMVGHSMGGLIARAVVAQSRHKVIMILNLASPMMIPVIGIDKNMVILYQEINNLWTETHRDDLVLISFTGGNRDFLVWDGYGRLGGTNHSLWLPTFSVKDVMVSTDHLCITWCRELIIAINKALHDSRAFLRQFSPQILLSNLQNHFQPQRPSEVMINSSIPNYHSLLFFSSVSSLSSPNKYHYVLSLPALSSVSRPLRLMVRTHGCYNVKAARAMLFSADNGHIHNYDLLHDPVILSLAESATKKHPIQLHLSLRPECSYTVTIYASVFDWAAQLIRIHLVRAPTFLSSLIILQYGHGSGSICPPSSMFLLFITVTFSSYFPLLFSNFILLDSFARIDIADMMMIFLLCLPILCTFSAIATGLKVSFSIIPSINLFKILALILPIIGILSCTFPPLGYLLLLFVHLLCINHVKDKLSLISKHSNHDKDNIISIIILILFFLELPSWFAELHSLIQHYNILDVLSMEVSKMIHLHYYCVPSAKLLVVTVVVLLRLIRSSTFMGDSYVIRTGLWLISIVLATCCILFSVIDTIDCTFYLIGSMLIFQIF